MGKIWISAMLLMFSAAAFAVTGNGGSFEFTDGTGFTLKQGKSVWRGGFTLYSDNAKKLLPLTGSVGAKDSAAFSAPDVRMELKVTAHERLFLIEFAITNTGSTALRLEPGINLTLRREPEQLFWGGFDVLEAGGKPLKRLGFKGRTSKHLSGGLTSPFPVAAMLNRNNAVILGQQQFTLSSYNAAFYTPVAKKSAKLAFSQRIVVEPGKTLKSHFVTGVVPRRFDCEENVVQAFYDAFPENWRPFIDQDNPYIWAAHSQYMAWSYGTQSHEAERRRYATIDWAYTPYKRAGDGYGHKELWDYKPGNHDFRKGFGQMHNGQFFDYRTMTNEDFHARRKAIFAKNGRDFGYSFYVCAGWCEEKLAKEKFPDSLTTDPDVPTLLHGWSTGHDNEQRVYPFGNSYGKFFQNDIRLLAEELDLPGFAFDCGTPGVIHRGAAAQNPEVPGRAWDDKGYFLDELCSIISLVDYVHKLRPADPLYVWKNGDGPADYIMIETDLFSPIFKSWMPLMRYNIGQRPAVLHVRNGFMFKDTIPNWRNMKYPEFEKEWAKLGDHIVLSDFEYGMTQTHGGYNGNPQGVYGMPELLECIRNGWQALIPVAVNNNGRMLYRARYGRGASTILYYGNPWEEPMPLDFKVDNSALGAGVNFFVPKMRDYAALENRIVNGDTCFKATLPSRVPFLLESVLNLSSVPAGTVAQVDSKKEIDRIVFTVKLNNQAPFRARITPRWIYDYTSSVAVNGKKIDPAVEQELPASAAVTVTFDSKYFRESAKKLRDWGYLDGNGVPNFTVLIPAKANAAEEKIARRIVEYFDFTARHKITKAPQIRIARGDSWPDSAIIVRVGRGGAPEIRIPGCDLIFNAPDAKTARRMMLQFFYVLDERFPYVSMPCNDLSYSQEMLDHFDLRKHHLPLRKCFIHQEAK